MADVLEKKPDLSDFANILPNWTKEEALEIEVLDEAVSVMNFNVTRCRYAEMYEEMGLKDIGHPLHRQSYEERPVHYTYRSLPSLCVYVQTQCKASGLVYRYCKGQRGQLA